MKPDDWQALEAAYHEQVSRLFAVLCEALATTTDQKSPTERYRRGLLNARKAYEIASYAMAAPKD